VHSFWQPRRGWKMRLFRQSIKKKSPVCQIIL